MPTTHAIREPRAIDITTYNVPAGDGVPARGTMAA
jgi:hypothetical protein